MESEINIVALGTQYSFWIAFSVMIAGVLYFHMERNNLTPRYSVVATISGMVAIIAAINYHTMKDLVGLSGTFEEMSNFPTRFRYIDWLLTTPLILATIPILINSRNKGAMITKLVVADIIMIVTGYIGEVDVNRAGGGTGLAWGCFIVGFLAFVYILFTLYGEVSEAASKLPREIQGYMDLLKNFLVISWLIYPLGYIVPLLGYSGDYLILRELIYNIADIFSKVGFGIVAVAAAKQLSQYEVAKMREEG